MGFNKKSCSRIEMGNSFVLVDGYYYFNHLSNHLKNSYCHRSAFCGFKIQWFSSGYTSIRVGVPLNLAALKAIMPCDARIR